MNTISVNTVKLSVHTKCRIMDAIDLAFEQGKTTEAERLYNKLNLLGTTYWHEYISAIYPINY